MRAFQCLRCGACCRNLVVKEASFETGLLLLPPEVDLFPPQLVRPYFRCGERVVAYQFVGRDCPHLGETGCSVYDRRPLACRAFPVETWGPLRIVRSGCRAVAGVPESELEDIHFPEEVWRANRFLAEYLMSNRITSAFDFRRGVWLEGRALAEAAWTAAEPVLTRAAGKLRR